MRVGATRVGATRGRETAVGTTGATGRGGIKGIMAAKPAREGIVNGVVIKPNVGAVNVVGRVIRPGVGTVPAPRVAFPNQPVKPVEANGEPRKPPKVGAAGMIPSPPHVGVPSPPKVGAVGFRKPNAPHVGVPSPPKVGTVGISVLGNPVVVVGVVPGRGGVKYITELKVGIGNCACA